MSPVKWNLIGPENAVKTPTIRPKNAVKPPLIRPKNAIQILRYEGIDIREAEVDFIVQIGGKVAPIEAKAGGNKSKESYRVNKKNLKLVGPAGFEPATFAV